MISQDFSNRVLSVHRASPLALLNYLETVFPAESRSLCRNHQIDRLELSSPFGRIPVEKTIQLWQAARRISGERFSPAVLSEFVPLGVYQAFDYMLNSCETPEQALKSMQKYSAIVSEAFEFSVLGSNSTFEIEINMKQGISLPENYIEFVFSILVNRCKAFSGGMLQPSKIDLSDDRFISAKSRVFSGAAGMGNQRTNRVVLAVSNMHSRMPNSDPRLREILEDYLQEMLNQNMGQDHFQNELEKAIEYGFSLHDVRLINVAKRLSISPRTLERRLRERGTSYRAILESMRIRRFKKFFTQIPFNVEEFTNLLCFSEPRAFYRAFKRWNGTTPAQYRDSMKQRLDNGGFSHV